MRFRELFLAEKERFELSRRYSRPTPLAGAPLRPLEYFSLYSPDDAVCKIIGRYYYTTFRFICQAFFLKKLHFPLLCYYRCVTATLISVTGQKIDGVIAKAGQKVGAGTSSDTEPCSKRAVRCEPNVQCRVPGSLQQLNDCFVTLPSPE